MAVRLNNYRVSRQMVYYMTNRAPNPAYAGTHNHDDAFTTKQEVQVHNFNSGYRYGHAKLLVPQVIHGFTSDSAMCSSISPQHAPFMV